MKIVVCIKQVPDTTEIKLDPVTGTMIRDGVPSIMNPDDKGGLEMALALKDKYGAQVTVITMGPPQADDILREAFAMGADRAIHLSDRKFAGADTLATSNAIAGALRMLDFDLVITGRQAIDGDTAQVGPQIAEHLDLPQVTYVENLEFDGDKLFTIRKSTEEGYQTVQVESPCVVTVLATANKARYETNGFSYDDGVIDVEPIRDEDGTLTGLKQSSDADFNARTKEQEALKAELEKAGITAGSGSFEQGDPNYRDDSRGV